MNTARVTGGDDADDVDNELMAELRALAGRYDPVPSEAIAAARSAFAWLTLDAELAELASEPEMAGVRGADGPELLTFEAPGLAVEVEALVVRGRCRLLGQLVPPGPGTVEVRHGGGTLDVAADEVGRFTADDVSPGPVSLWCMAGSRVVQTDWFLV